MSNDNLMSLQSHILAEEQQYPGATGDFSWILSAISLSAKTIANKVRRARIDDVLGEHGESAQNVHGEQQQKLDVLANELIMRCLGDRANVGVLASEEDEEPRLLRARGEGGRYAVLFDPLDGSSNLDFCVGVGTIFSIIKLSDEHPTDAEAAILQQGVHQVAAGYVLYGSSVVLILTTGRGVHMFVLDQSIGSFVLVERDIKIPKSSKTYSVNEAYTDTFPPGYKQYLNWAHQEGYSSRYIGSMVADVHRTLLKGGVFLYPPTAIHPNGKLRLMYEANPMAMVIEQAGGKAINGETAICDMSPTGLHQRTSVILGSAEEVEHVQRFL